MDVLSYTNENTKDLVGAATLNNRGSHLRQAIENRWLFHFL